MSTLDNIMTNLASWAFGAPTHILDRPALTIIDHFALSADLETSANALVIASDHAGPELAARIRGQWPKINDIIAKKTPYWISKTGIFTAYNNALAATSSQDEELRDLAFVQAVKLRIAYETALCTSKISKISDFFPAVTLDVEDIAKRAENPAIKNEIGQLWLKAANKAFVGLGESVTSGYYYISVETSLAALNLIGKDFAEKPLSEVAAKFRLDHVPRSYEQPFEIREQWLRETALRLPPCEVESQVAHAWATLVDQKAKSNPDIAVKSLATEVALQADTKSVLFELANARAEISATSDIELGHAGKKPSGLRELNRGDFYRSFGLEGLLFR